MWGTPGQSWVGTWDTRSCGNYALSVTGFWLCSGMFHLSQVLTAASLAHAYENAERQTATASQKEGSRMPLCSLQGRGSTVEEIHGVSASATKPCMSRGDINLLLSASTSLTLEKAITACLQPSILHRQQEPLRGERQRRETEERLGQW